MRTSESKKIRTNIITSLTDANNLKTQSDGICIFEDCLYNTHCSSPAELEEFVFLSIRQLFEEEIGLFVTVIFKTRFDTVSNEHLEKLKAIARGIFRAAVYGEISIMYNANAVQNRQKYDSFGSFINNIFCELEGDRREFNGYIKKGVLIGSPTEICECDTRGIDFLCIDLDRILPHILCKSYTKDATRKIYLHGRFESLCSTLSEYFSETRLPIRIMSADISSNSFVLTLAETLDAEEIIIQD